MTKRALFAAAGFLGLCLSVSAEPVDQLPFDGSTLDQPALRVPPLSLDQDRFFFSSSFGWVRPTREFLPPFSQAEPWSAGRSALPGRRDSVDDIVDR